MSDWKQPPGLGLDAINRIWSYGIHCLVPDAALNAGQGGNVAAAWPSANLAIFAPVVFERRCSVTNFGWAASTSSGHTDAGLYDQDFNRIVSLGSTLTSAGGGAVASTVVGPGCFYLALACDNTTATFYRLNPTALLLRACGVQQQASAFPLPSTATPVGASNAYFPQINSTVTTS